MTQEEKKQAMFDKIGSFLPLVTVLIFIGYAIGAYLMVLLPQIEKAFTGTQSEIQLIKADIASGQKNSEILTRDIEGFTNMNSREKEKVRTALPTEQQIQQIFVDVDSIARKNGLLLDSIDSTLLQDSITADGMVAIRIALGVSGAEYRNFKLFLGDIESNVRISNVESVMFTPGGGSYSVIFNAYFIGDPNMFVEES